MARAAAPVAGGSGARAGGSAVARAAGRGRRSARAPASCCPLGPLPGHARARRRGRRRRRRRHGRCGCRAQPGRARGQAQLDGLAQRLQRVGRLLVLRGARGRASARKGQPFIPAAHGDVQGLACRRLVTRRAHAYSRRSRGRHQAQPLWHVRAGAHGHVERVARARGRVRGLQQRAADAAALVLRQHQHLRHAQARAVRVRIEAVHRAEAGLRARAAPAWLPPLHSTDRRVSLAVSGSRQRTQAAEARPRTQVPAALSAQQAPQRAAGRRCPPRARRPPSAVARTLVGRGQGPRGARGAPQRCARPRGAARAAAPSRGRRHRSPTRRPRRTAAAAASARAAPAACVHICALHTKLLTLKRMLVVACEGGP